MMRSLYKIILLLLSTTPCLATETISGLWARDGHNERLEFFDCDGKLCAKGEIPGPSGQPPLVLRYAEKTAPNQWKGDLFNPENGKLYSGSVTLETPNHLTLTGCLIGFLCQSETWTRVQQKTSPEKTPPAKAHAK